MRVTLRQKNIEITPALRVYIESKILKPVARLMKTAAAGDLPVLDLEFGRSTRHHKKGKVYHAAASLSMGKILLRAEVDDEDIRAACDFLGEELEREISRLRSRKRARDLREDRRNKKNIRLDPGARTYRKGRIRDEGN